jgi:DHA2 family multidrug resistance protein
MAAQSYDASAIPPSRRLLAGLVLALSNFMVVLDLTIANVSVPHIAGNLGISADQGRGSSPPMRWRRRSACR